MVRRTVNDSEPSAGDVVRDFLGRAVGNLLHYDPVVRRHRDTEGIHQMRVSVRHLRAEMRVAAPVLRAKDHEALDGELKWLGATLGRLRDLDVLADLFADGGSAGVATPAAVTSRLNQQRAAESRRVARTLRAPRYRRLMERLSHAVVDPPLRKGSAVPASSVLGPELREVVTDLMSIFDGLDADSPADELHRVRIKVKRCRYTCELAESFLESAAAAATALEHVQSVLGDLHDHVVARDYLSDVTRPREMFGEAHDDATIACAAWLDGEITRLLGAWPAPVHAARVAMATVADALYIKSSDAPVVPVK